MNFELMLFIPTFYGLVPTELSVGPVALSWRGLAVSLRFSELISSSLVPRFSMITKQVYGEGGSLLVSLVPWIYERIR